MLPHSFLASLAIAGLARAAPALLNPSQLAPVELDWSSQALEPTRRNVTRSSWFRPMFQMATHSMIINPKTRDFLTTAETGTTTTNRKPTFTKTSKPTSSITQKPQSATVSAGGVSTSEDTSSSEDDTSSTPTATSATFTSKSTTATSTQTGPLYTLPSSVADLYRTGQKKQCTHQMDTRSTPFIDNGSGGTNAHYCGDKDTNPSVIWWMGNMDVDCDGASKSGPCGNDPTHQTETAFTYKNKPIDAQEIPYVVINDDWSFRPAKFGLKGLNVVGVVCGGKLTWAIFGDTNPYGAMGEASLKLAQTCFGSKMTGNFGYDPSTVLYFAFTGSESIDSLGGTNFTRLADLGESLLTRLDS